MTEHVLIQVGKLSFQRSLTSEIRFDGGTPKKLKRWLGHYHVYRSQGEGDLGSRMHRAIINALQSGKTSVIIIGTDVPGISSPILERAYNALTGKPLVIGPAEDGGYYLIGVNTCLPARALKTLFQDIRWGSDGVYHETINRARKAGVAYEVLDILRDVDRPEDIPVWRNISKQYRYNASPESISVVIPTLNEARQLFATIQSVRNGSRPEIIVTDGGSTDNTLEVAASMGARIIKSRPPKSFQLNAGAIQAKGDVLLFLHADTTLPRNYHDMIIQCLEEPSIGCGAFELGIGSPALKIRMVENMANFRSRTLKQPYGDQAIFVPSRIFFKVGGFPRIPIMEDYEFIRRIRKNWKVATLPARVTTSPRRWNNLGVIRTTIINQLIIAAYHAGVPAGLIARIYQRNRGLSRHS